MSYIERRLGMKLPAILEVSHNCALAPWPYPHTVALAFTKSEKVTEGTRLTGVRCDGTAIEVTVNRAGEVIR